MREDIEVAKIAETYRNRQTVDKYSYLASRDEIKENDYNLNIPRYVNTFEEEAEIDIAAVQERIISIERDLAEVRDQMAACLKELGL